MEEEVRKELHELCESIINDTQTAGLENHLTNVQMLYEKLLILNYLQARHSQKKADIKVKENETRQETRFDEEQVISKTEPAQKVEEAPKPEPTRPEEPEKTEIPPQYRTPEFVEKQPLPKPEKPETENAPQPLVNESPVPEKELTDDIPPEEEHPTPPPPPTPAPGQSVGKTSSLNQRYGSGAIRLGLNDRIAFVNHLFEGKQEDLNRVLSQLNTFENFAEAENFISNVIKPDYDWTEKEDFEERLMFLVRQRFGEE